MEVKLDCQLGDARRSQYRVETYFFVPRSLGLTPHTYPRAQFYHDVQTYLRFKTPSIPLADLADHESGESPLEHIRRLAENLRRGARDARRARALSYELRMFGCVIRAGVRDRAAALQSRIRDLPAGARARTILIADIAGLSASLVADVVAVLASWRSLRTSVLVEPVPVRLQETFALVDEYVSFAVEVGLTELLEEVDRSPGAGELRAVRRQLIACIVAERDYRVGAGYGDLFAESDDESLVYRRGMLKKLVTSVLWLEVDKEQEGRSIADAAAGAAAGVAMLFTVLATILHMRWWMINTAGFVVAAVLTYILKDRIKDWLKRFFHQRYSRFLADYNVKIRDPMTGAYVGRSRESFGFVDDDRVPDDVAALRRRDAGSPVELEARRETVLKYDKEIRLEGQEVLERVHFDGYDLNDISRFALRELLARADDPDHVLPVYDARSDGVHSRTFHKVYHLNIVMVLGAGPRRDRTTTMRRLRVVFDKHAIRRLEEIASEF